MPKLPMKKGKLTTDVDINIQEKTVTAYKYFTEKKNPKKQIERNMYPKPVTSITILYNQMVTYFVNIPPCSS
jgi:hypothetical protein